MTRLLETARLALRGWSLDDAEPMFAIYGDPLVVAHMLRPPYASVAEARDRIVQSIADAAESGRGLWRPVIERDGGALVGVCGFRAQVGGGARELGFTIARSRWGRGYGAEIVEACLPYAFAHLGATSVRALTLAANAPARRVLERVGMRYAGVERDEGAEWCVYVATP